MKGVIWGALGVTFCFVILRAVIRLKVFRRFFADDAFVLVSWLLFLANVILYQNMLDGIYLAIDVYSGQIAPPPDVLEKVLVFLHKELAVNLLFLTSLWAIKASFLVFFRRLVYQIRPLMILWWVVVFSTVASFAISVGVTEYRCTTNTNPLELISKFVGTCEFERITCSYFGI